MAYFPKKIVHRSSNRTKTQLTHQRSQSTISKALVIDFINSHNRLLARLLQLTLSMVTVDY